MPYIKANERVFIQQEAGLNAFVDWINTVPVEKRKGFVAYILEYIAKYSFDNNYFGISTGVDALRSAFTEMEKDLITYEKQKREENGEV